MKTRSSRFASVLVFRSRRAPKLCRFAAVICATVCLAPVAFGVGPGDPDPAFNAPLITGGFPTTVSAVATQSDGKILLGGNFTTVCGNDRPGLARLNADGSLDTSFTPATNVPPDVRAIAIQTEGRILLGIAYPAAAKPSVLRLQADGSIDPEFNLGVSSALRGALALLLDAEGRILVGGGTLATSPDHLFRLLPSGLNDGTFIRNYSLNSSVETLASGSDGRWFLGGRFTSPRYGLVRLETNGPLASFGLSVPTNFVAHALAVQADGRVIVGGSFTLLNNIGRTNLARLNATGTLDTTFNAGLGPNGEIRSLALQPDNKVLVAGNFTAFNARPCAGVARVQTNGVLDTGFNPGAGAELENPVLALQTDGAILA